MTRSEVGARIAQLEAARQALRSGWAAADLVEEEQLRALLARMDAQAVAE